MPPPASAPQLQALPIDPLLPEIAAALSNRGALVLVAPPGAGKTTRVPPALLDAGLAERGQIVLVSPRRIAAQAAAARIAQERGWTLGREAGYQVRFESRSSRHTRILAVTEGILTRRLQDDPFLEGTAAVILDEFHERSIHADLAIALLREVRASARPDLALIVMSATLNAAPIARFLGDCPVLESAGRPHPVEVRYAERPLPYDRDGPDGDAIAAALRPLWGASRGHVLVFLPGIAAIRRAESALEGVASAAGAALLTLHGSLSLDEQRAVLAPSSRRKIILSTNVAESSLTIDGVDAVIDSGLARVLRHDADRGLDRLEIARISRHSAEQRAGRAGRQGPGQALRLWTRAEHAAMPEDEAPEIRRADLAGTVLALRAWGIADPSRFGWLEAPETRAIERAEEMLRRLGALAADGALTPTGRALLALPVQPRLARLLVAAAAAGRIGDGARLAALLEERDVLRPRRGRDAPPPSQQEIDRRASDTGGSDLLFRLQLFREAERAGFGRRTLDALGLERGAVHAVERLARQLERAARQELGDAAGREGGGGQDALRRILLPAYPDRVARRRARDGERGLMVGGRGVVLARESVAREGEFFIALDLDGSARGPRGEALVRQASRIERAWIEAEFPADLREVRRCAFDPESEKVRCEEALAYRDLPLEEPRQRPPPADEAERLLAAAARERAAAIVEADEDAARLLARLRFLRSAMPELSLPAFDAALLGEVLASASTGLSGLDELRRAGIAGLIRGRLERAQLEALERHAPEALAVPSGSRIRLDYAAGDAPVLAARLQELFGLAETPRLAAGRVPIVLHILGPNYRPVQVTRDIRSFWDTTYAQVRKDLRARYPKHAWPEDPWQGRAERRPGGKRTRER